METAKQKILMMQTTLEVWKMKANNVGELKTSVASEKNWADLLQAELRTTRNKLDKVLKNSNKQDRDSKIAYEGVDVSPSLCSQGQQHKSEILFPGRIFSLISSPWRQEFTIINLLSLNQTSISTSYPA